MAVPAPIVLGGRYELEDLLGRGGMAAVYRGTDHVLGRGVAIKVLSPTLSRDPAAVERFRREAQAAAALSHPGIVTVFDTGSEGDLHYIVMELVEGRTLAAILAERGKLRPEVAATVAARVADALAYAHDAGVIHRDVKPGNIMVTRGRVKVMDFGIARVLSSHTLTETASILGTASYLAPEQAQGQPVDARTDVYAVGVVLYQMLTGRPPFVADTPVAVAVKHVGEPPQAPSELEPAVPPELDAEVLRALAKDPSERHGSAVELAARLDAVKDGLLGGAGAVTAIAAADDDEHAAPEAAPKRRWARLGTLATILVAGAMSVAFLLPEESRTQESPRPPAADQPDERDRDRGDETTPEEAATETSSGSSSTQSGPDGSRARRGTEETEQDDPTAPAQEDQDKDVVEPPEPTIEPTEQPTVEPTEEPTPSPQPSPTEASGGKGAAGIA